eukprot:COSAG02_NODE_36830_length_450_cov_0.578348_1_plen_33_part_01
MAVALQRTSLSKVVVGCGRRGALVGPSFVVLQN